MKKNFVFEEIILKKKKTFLFASINIKVCHNNLS